MNDDDLQQFRVWKSAHAAATGAALDAGTTLTAWASHVLADAASAGIRFGANALLKTPEDPELQMLRVSKAAHAASKSAAAAVGMRHKEWASRVLLRAAGARRKARSA